MSGDGLIAVAGAAGNVGGAVARSLVARGVRPRLLVRDRSRLAAVLCDAAAVHEADITDAAALGAALDGVDQLYWFTPNRYDTPDPDGYFRAVAQTAAAAVRASGIRRVVLLSAAGVDQDGFGQINLHRHVERRFEEAGTDLAILRPAYFFENFLRQVGPLRGGQLFEPHPPETRIPMIAADDIGAAAAAALLDPSWSGVVRTELVGPDDLSIAETLAVMGDAVGQAFRYVQVPLAAVGDTFRQHGASEEVVATYLQMFAALAEPGRAPPQDRTAPTVRTTPTGAAEWARRHLAAALAAPA